jgi:AcrR family transcriptional regulator
MTTGLPNLATGENAAAAPRRPGRPRSAEAESAILDAALELLVDEGLDSVTMEAVAARAGVGKTTIYRRWASQDEMLAAALQQLTGDIAVPDTGSVRGDLVALLEHMHRVTLKTLSAAMMARLIACTLTSPRQLDIVIAHLYEPRKAAIVQILRRGVQREELRADLDVELAFAMFIGPGFVRTLLEAQEPFKDPALGEKLIDMLLRGVANPT